MFNRTLMLSLAFVCLIGLTGCLGGGGLAGTWRSADSQAGDFSVGGMTLATDGTYTAYANYDGNTRGFSGRWSVENDELVLDAANRRYRIAHDGDSLTLTDPKTNVATSMKRQN